MIRAAAVLTLLALWSGAAPGQAPGLLHVRVSLTDAARGTMPVPRYALLVSDNPSSSAPRRVITAADGTATIRLPPGNYTVESDEPVTFNGKVYQWSQEVDITAGGDVVLELTAGNALLGAPASSDAPNDLLFLLPQWKDSIVAVWTAASRGSGFLVDASGLVVTSQRVVGNESAVDVQLTPSVKIAARVLAADRARDVAVLWIDPATAASMRPLPLGCAAGSRPPFADRQKLAAIGAPFSGPKELSPGNVIRLEPRGVVVDFRLAPGSAGGPVFSTGGSLVGLSSIVDDQEDTRNRDARIVPVDDACEVIVSAEKAMRTAKRPAATHLPVEPLQPVPADVLEAEVQRRAGNLNAYPMSSSDFDLGFLTPVLVAGQQHSTQRNPLKDFGRWSDYFAEVPRVLVVRVTPKLVESLWMTLARGAAYTQGAALPPIRHFKPGFARLRAYCGDVEVTPIHPFVLEQRLSDTDAVREGLYVFDPEALGPQCKAVKLLLYSEKAPQKPDTLVIDPALIDRIARDFAT